MNLGTNGLTGSIPSEIGNLKSLEFLALNNNEFHGALSKEFGFLTNLSK
jgi:hypothetical protein